MNDKPKKKELTVEQWIKKNQPEEWYYTQVFSEETSENLREKIQDFINRKQSPMAIIDGKRAKNPEFLKGFFIEDIKFSHTMFPDEDYSQTFHNYSALMIFTSEKEW